MSGRHGFWLSSTPLVLASGSFARRALLEAAGIPVEIRKTAVDEAGIAENLVGAGADSRAIAAALAEAKSAAAALLAPGRLLLAADQTLDFEGRLLMKAETPTMAGEQLTRMRGKAHRLHSAAVLRQGPKVLWRGSETATLHMRAFSDAFLETYLGEMGARACATVGGYELEALGVHLFERIDGDHATILGLPMLPLLEALGNLGLLVR